MNDYKELIENLRSNTNNVFQQQAANAIEQLVKERDGWMIAYDGAQRAYHEWFAEAQKLMKERDAAIADLKYTSLGGRGCYVCKNKNYPTSEVCMNCHTGTLNDHWEWRGVQE